MIEEPWETDGTLPLPPADVRTPGRGPHAVTAFSGRSASGYHDPPHIHDRGQFSYRVKGVALVSVAGRSLLLPPGRGVWIPAGVRHAVHCQGPTAYHAFYARPASPSALDAVRLIDVTPLLAALIGALVEGAAGARHAAIVALMLDELARTSPVRDDAVPVMPVSPRLRELCAAVRAAPAERPGIDRLAASIGMSRRSFTRQFRAETGMSFGVWQHHARLVQAIEWLAEGTAVQQVAYRLGYGSTASILRAFGDGLRPSAPLRDAVDGPASRAADG